MRFVIDRIETDYFDLGGLGGRPAYVPDAAIISGRLVMDDGAAYPVALPVGPDEMDAIFQLADSLTERARQQVMGR